MPIRKRGQPHVTIVLRTIVESEGNESELVADVIGAISDLVRTHPRWVNLGLAFIEAFDKISLAEIRKTAKATGVQPLRDAIMTLLCLDLEKLLGPSRLPKPLKPPRIKREPKPPRAVTRIPEIEKAITLGKELLALREATPSNTQFGRRASPRSRDAGPNPQGADYRCAGSRYLYAHSICGPGQPASTDPRRCDRRNGVAAR
jgi:hypothetical protein